MENFLLGLEAIYNGTVLSVKQITQYQLFWGFVTGFLVSTLVHGFLITDNTRHVPTILLRDKSISFQKLHQREEGMPYQTSFHTFSKNADKLKITFGIAFILLMFVVLLAVINI